jgi:hypothetical protein
VLLIGCAALFIVGLALFFGRAKDGQANSPVIPDREFADASPAEIMSVFQGNTAIQSDKLLRPHIGKWLRVTGPLHNVTTWSPTGHFSQVTLDNFTGNNIWMWFVFNDKRVVEGRLAALRIGTQLTIVGKISEIGRLGITLEECQIESVVSEPSGQI